MASPSLVELATPLLLPCGFGAALSARDLAAHGIGAWVDPLGPADAAVRKSIGGVRQPLPLSSHC